MAHNHILDESIFVRSDSGQIVETDYRLPTSEESSLIESVRSGVGVALTQKGYIEALSQCMLTKNMPSYVDVIRAVGGYYGLPLYLWKPGKGEDKEFMKIPFSLNESVRGVFTEYEEVERFVVNMLYLTYSGIGSIAMVSDKHVNSVFGEGEPKICKMRINEKKLRILKDLRSEKRFLVETILA